MKVVRLWLVVLLIGSLLLPGGAAAAQGKGILYIPFDDRPVSLDYVADTFRQAGACVLVPPEAELANRERTADPERLWSWLENHVRHADRLAISADALLYGGLVGSRTHFLEEDVIQERVERFARLKEKNPFLKIYVFSTVMRSPKMSAGNVEPPYYEKYGPQIFRITALADKEEQQPLTALEHQQRAEALHAVPPALLGDWLERRRKNLAANRRLVELTQAGAIDYLLLGRDDTSPYSQSRRELRQLLTVAEGLPLSRFGSFPGADQLGILMVTRAVNDLERQLPVVEVRYAIGAGPATVPAYEDQPFGQTVFEHIAAAGGIALRAPLQPDFLLAVNTPYHGTTLEANDAANRPRVTPRVWSFVQEVKKAVAAGRRVAVADIAFANGSDNGLMQGLEDEKLLEKLSAYSGWNTASNTLGYAIAQGMMAPRFSEAGRKHLLAVRYLDEWAYQADLRLKLSNEIVYAQGGDIQYLNQLNPAVTRAAEREIRAFALQRLWLEPEDHIAVSFPWNRMFEIHIMIDSPQRR